MILVQLAGGLVALLGYCAGVRLVAARPTTSNSASLSPGVSAPTRHYIALIAVMLLAYPPYAAWRLVARRPCLRPARRRISAARRDRRSVCCAAQVLFALNSRYLINEKAALQEAQGFPLTLADLPGRAQAVWFTTVHDEFARAIETLKPIASDLRGLSIQN